MVVKILILRYYLYFVDTPGIFYYNCNNKKYEVYLQSIDYIILYFFAMQTYKELILCSFNLSFTEDVLFE